MTDRAAPYRTVQWSWFPVPVILFLLVIEVVVLWSLRASGDLTAGSAIVTSAISTLVILVVLVFARQVVEVDDTEVRTWFGFGWPTRAIRFTDVTAVRKVRNSGWYGWGIRWIPNGSMYNTWGYEAVEFGLTSGRVFRIGTADRDGLADAVAARTGHTVETPGD